jgi:Four helical bundle domain
LLTPWAPPWHCLVAAPRPSGVERAARVQAIQRKACLIADNMSKLVDDPVHAAPFLPSVMPLAKRVSEEVADPEVRTVAGKALKTLQRIETDAAEIAKVRSTSPKWVAEQLRAAGAGADKVPGTPADFVKALAMTLIDCRSFDKEEWVDSVTAPYVAPFLGEAEAKKVGDAFVEACRREVRSRPLCLPHTCAAQALQLPVSRCSCHGLQPPASLHQRKGGPHPCEASC